MKTKHFFTVRQSLLASGMIALVILLSIGGPAFAARVAGTDENVNTTIAPAPVDAVKQVAPAA